MNFKVDFQALCVKQRTCPGPDVKTIWESPCASCINQYVRQFNLESTLASNDYVNIVGKEQDCLTFILAHDTKYITHIIQC